MARAVLLLTVLLLAACAKTGSGSSPADDVVGEWEFASGTADGQPLPQPEGSRATLVFDGAEASGQAFCNHFGAPYSLDGDSVRIDDIWVTEMACEQVMDAESQFIGALSAISTVAFDGEDLVLTGDDVELRFHPIPPIPTSLLTGTDWVLESLIDGETVSSVPGGLDPPPPGGRHLHGDHGLHLDVRALAGDRRPGGVSAGDRRPGKRLPTRGLRPVRAGELRADDGLLRVDRRRTGSRPSPTTAEAWFTATRDPCRRPTSASRPTTSQGCGACGRAPSRARRSRSPLRPGERSSSTADGSTAPRSATGSVAGTGSTASDSCSRTSSRRLVGCAGDVAAAEHAFHGVLNAPGLSLTVDPMELVLTSDAGELRFTRVPPVPEADLVGRRWVLETVAQGGTASAAVGEAVLELREDGTATFSTGCPTMNGTWTARGDTVLFANQVYEPIPCPHAMNDQDSLVTQTLSGGFQPLVDGDVLTVTNLDTRGAPGVTLTYRAG